MKNVSLALNVVLFAAVIFLYVKVFSGNRSSATATVHTQASVTPGTISKAAIAYIELDSLNDRIDYIRVRRTELEGEQKSIETEWQSGYMALDERKNEFLKKGNSITQQEAEKFQGELIQQQQKVDGRKQSRTQQLSERSYTFLEDVQKKLKDFLAEYNKDKNYQYILTIGGGAEYMLYKDPAFNITADVIKGMNEKLSKK